MKVKQSQPASTIPYEVSQARRQADTASLIKEEIPRVMQQYAQSLQNSSKDSQMPMGKVINFLFYCDHTPVNPRKDTVVSFTRQFFLDNIKPGYILDDKGIAILSCLFTAVVTPYAASDPETRKKNIDSLVQLFSQNQYNKRLMRMALYYRSPL